ncbi:unnamed protein product [Fusarium graminearum]|nr:unnamed protein product [Fusarium graminearum]VTO84889.1 unnamed protein product [Fusarium graminearum]
MGHINKQIGARNLVDMKTHLAFLAKGSVTKQRLRRLLAPSSSEGTNSYLQKWYPLFYAHKIAGNLGRYNFTTDTAQFTCPTKPWKTRPIPCPNCSSFRSWCQFRLLLPERYKSVAVHMEKR